MKINIFFISTVTLLLIAVAHSCFEQKEPELPPETQTGANTFGCYVNGVLLVPTYSGIIFDVPRLEASLYIYFQSGDSVLNIKSRGKNGDCSLFVLNPEENIKKTLMRVTFTNDYRDYDGRDVGEIIITRFDTINRIFSGTFVVKNIGMTQGRFDIRNLSITKY